MKITHNRQRSLTDAEIRVSLIFYKDCICNYCYFIGFLGMCAGRDDTTLSDVVSG